MLLCCAVPETLRMLADDVDHVPNTVHNEEVQQVCKLAREVVQAMKEYNVESARMRREQAAAFANLMRQLDANEGLMNP